MITPLKMCHFASFSTRKVVRISPTDPALTIHPLPWAAAPSYGAEMQRNRELTELTWCSKMVLVWENKYHRESRQGRTPVQLSWREPSRAEQSQVEQAWAVQAVVLVGATWIESSIQNDSTEPKWKGTQALHSRAAVQCGTDKAALAVWHCFLLCWAQGWEEVAARSSLHPVIDPGDRLDTTYGESLPSCLCPSRHAEPHWGGKYLLCVKHLPFFNTFVIILLLLLCFFYSTVFCFQ